MYYYPTKIGRMHLRLKFDMCLSNLYYKHEENGLGSAKIEDVIKHDRLTEIAFMKEFYEYLKNKDQNLGVYFKAENSGYLYEDSGGLSIKKKV